MKCLSYIEEARCLKVNLLSGLYLLMQKAVMLNKCRVVTEFFGSTVNEEVLGERDRYCCANELNCCGVKKVDNNSNSNNKPLSLNFRTAIHSNFIP